MMGGAGAGGQNASPGGAPGGMPNISDMLNNPGL